MEKVNVYDFDKTILPYDSTEAFFRHCLRRYPRVLFPALGALPWAAGMPLGLTSKTRAKEVFYRFLALVPDIDAELTRFWELHLGDINAWYLARGQAQRLDPGREQPRRGKGAPPGEGVPRARHS